MRNPQFLNTPDDVQWAFAVHVKTLDTNNLRDVCLSFLMSGNEDTPDELWFYISADPLMDDVPVLHLVRSEESGELVKVAI